MAKFSMRGPFAGVDPRAALIGAMFISIITACLDSIAACALALAYGLIMLSLSGLPARAVLKRLLTANVFVFFIWLVTPWTTPGTPLPFSPPLNPTIEGVRLCLLVTLKANALVCIFIALITPIPLSRLGAALASLHVPHKLIWLLILMDRNVNNLQNEYNTLMDAARLRGFRAATSMRTYRLIASLLAILLLRAFDRGERMYEAMLLRGFNGNFPFAADFSLSLRDACLAITLLLLSFCLLGIQTGVIHV